MCSTRLEPAVVMWPIPAIKLESYNSNKKKKKTHTPNLTDGWLNNKTFSKQMHPDIHQWWGDAQPHLHTWFPLLGKKYTNMKKQFRQSFYLQMLHLCTRSRLFAEFLKNMWVLICDNLLELPHREWQWLTTIDWFKQMHLHVCKRWWSYAQDLWSEYKHRAWLEWKPNRHVAAR